MIRRLHEKFEALSKPVRLTYVSIASVTFIMLIMTMIAVEANRQMFARFADDMVKFIGEDMTKQIEGSLDLSIQPVINFHDFDNTTSSISKEDRNAMYIEYLARALHSVKDDVGVSRYYYANQHGDMIMVEQMGDKNMYRIIESEVKPDFVQKHYLISAESLKLVEKEGTYKKGFDPRARDWFEAVSKRRKQTGQLFTKISLQKNLQLLSHLHDWIREEEKLECLPWILIYRNS